MAGLQRSVKADQRNVVMKCFKILDTAGTPTLSVGSTDGSITDNGVGDYTITFASPLDRAMAAHVTPMQANAIAYVHALSASAITVKVTEADGSTADDSSVLVTVIGALAEET